MKQVVENLKTGETQLIDVPEPKVGDGHLLIRTEASLISIGTERMLLEFGKAGLIKKARQQPDKVRQVLDKIKTDGLSPTIRAIRTKLDQPLPLGYSQAGKVIAVGDGVEGFKVSDRVASNGYHAEVISVPQNLCARIPEGVSAEEAAFTVLGSIALQGVRLAQPTLGETFAVVGVGLIGLLTVQLLQANGCQVIGIDVNPERLKIAAGFGADIGMEKFFNIKCRASGKFIYILFNIVLNILYLHLYNRFDSRMYCNCCNSKSIKNAWRWSRCNCW